MPSTITHNYFMKDVYDLLSDELKDNIILESAKTFSQGPDVFYFYNLGLGKKSYNYRNMGYYMHKNNINLYFYNLIKYIKDNDLVYNKECFSYLIGSVAHFVLDSTIHPFVYYNTGVFDKNIKDSYKYNGLHQEMEYYLDAYMIFQNEKMEAKNYKMYKYILNNKKLDNDTINMINNVIYDTFGYKNMGNIYDKCVSDMKRFFKILNYDPYGIKKCIYTLIDIVMPKKYILKRKFSFYFDHNSKREYLNLNRLQWNHPCDINEIYNYSFIELYVIAKSKCIHIINDIYKLLNDNYVNEEKIDDLFKNLSYTTGKDCTDKSISLKYFKF